MNELTVNRCRRLLESSPVAHLAVISRGEPYVTPISYVMVDDAICIRTMDGRRVEALRENPRVCLTVSHYDEPTGDWESVILWGDAEFVDDPRTAQQIIAAFFDKYRDVLGSPLNPAQQLAKEGVEIRIPVDIAAGRTSGSFFSVRSRPGRL